ncbi:putative PP-loop ATPase [Encephalitozoon intestinalis ATCC 50506]|uniref:Diphthine--ammonia ligase n=1 Tax=Encephalitozoon intestinalis (strain ATCC 50506) TaxID=876142 RepID=E0S8A5_ENCIT|nr:putative PP-loop ATPase [Encephalitozoon intestinalis ATCC 50506]ADM12111.1 putative PP-loop ATPase [Encephalitozoon intestinalis ATCC 50506]UTX45903.1 diphthamide synthase [Encephalitozoon intestinalis]
MKYLALASGGKDSLYAMHVLQREGHQVVGLLHMRCGDGYQDSFMYQTVGSEVADLLGECLGIPIFIYETKCKSINQNLQYKKEEGDEVEDLYEAIASAKEKIYFEGVSSGAILSKYQKNRVEDVCKRLSLRCLSPLWEMDQKKLLGEMISNGMEGRIVKVASSLLGRECINMGLDEIYDRLEAVQGLEVNFCGEGGEYESIILDCPMFKKRISIDKYEVTPHPEEIGREGIVFYMRILKTSLVEKDI